MDVHGKDGMQVIKENTEMLIGLPWNGEVGLFRIRMLNAVQLRACGNFTTLQLEKEGEEDKEDMTLDELIDIKNMQERLMKASMVSPTYQEVLDWLEATPIIETMKKTIADTRTLIRTTMDIQEAKKYEDELQCYEIQMAFLFPDDFMSTLTGILLQRDCTDIRKVTREMLFEWACKAERGHDNPADHAEGIFTEFQREDINHYAWLELAHYREMQDAEKSATKTWVRGRKKR